MKALLGLVVRYLKQQPVWRNLKIDGPSWICNQNLNNRNRLFKYWKYIVCNMWRLFSWERFLITEQQFNSYLSFHIFIYIHKLNVMKWINKNINEAWAIKQKRAQASHLKRNCKARKYHHAYNSCNYVAYVIAIWLRALITFSNLH